MGERGWGARTGGSGGSGIAPGALAVGGGLARSALARGPRTWRGAGSHEGWMRGCIGASLRRGCVLARVPRSQGTAFAPGLDAFAQGSTLARGLWACTGAVCVRGSGLAQALRACSAVCLHRGCACSHRGVFAQGLDVRLHTGAGLHVAARTYTALRAGLCESVCLQGAACLHRRVLVQGLNVRLHMGACLYGGCVCSRGPCALAQGLCAHTRGQHTPSPSSLCVALHKASHEAGTRARVPGALGTHSLARGCLCTCAVTGHRLLCSREGVCAPRTGMRAETGGGNAGPSRSGTFCTSAHKRVCTLTGVCTPLVQVCKLTGVRACLRMSAHARKRVHACVHLQTCVHALASAQVSFAPGCTLPREVCAQRGGADRIWRVSGWQGGPWWVQGWWGDMVTGCPGAMVMGRCGARVVG